MSFRTGVASTPDVASTTGGTATSFSVAPALPAGLSFDTSSGVVSGTPGGPAATNDYVVTASNANGQAQTTLTLQVTSPLPSTMTLLADGFDAVAWQSGLAMPARIAFAPDGRLFFNELRTGNTRVIDAAGNLVATPVASMTVLQDVHQGLLGLVLDPAFASNGFLYVYACVPAAGAHADRNQILRLTITGNVATATTVIVDDLPISPLDNGGHLAIGPDGRLYATLGDVNDPFAAQTPGVLPGRVLRYTTAGAIPLDNPIFGNPEWCRGLRNTFSLAFHPTAGTLLGADNGPTANDRLNWIQPGKDFGWPDPVAGGAAGTRLWTWSTVIAPTSLTYYAGGGFGAGFDDNLFVGSYVNDEVRRLAMSGPAFVDVDSETVFARWASTGVNNKPLDVIEGPDGALYVSTFDAIYRITKAP